MSFAVSPIPRTTAFAHPMIGFSDDFGSSGSGNSPIIVGIDSMG
jgi:hypothetical protein